MEIFRENDKVVNLIRKNYHLLPVLNRFDIKPGFKDKTVAQICKEQKINHDFFLAIVNTFNNSNYFPEEELLSFSPLLIVDYLKKTHKYYIDYMLPKLEQTLNQLTKGGKNYYNELNTIETFYKRYKEELLKHFNEEETKVFPYVIELLNNPNPSKREYTISDYEKEHDDVEMQVNDLKNLILKYLKPVYDVNIGNEFLIALFRFEQDILDHARIEDKILVPQVMALEKKLGI